MQNAKVFGNAGGDACATGNPSESERIKVNPTKSNQKVLLRLLTPPLSFPLGGTRRGRKITVAGLWPPNEWRTIFPKYPIIEPLLSNHFPLKILP
jgi:hypothetical protein